MCAREDNYKYKKRGYFVYKSVCYLLATLKAEVSDGKSDSVVKVVAA